MNRTLAYAAVSVFLLAAPSANLANETGMSHDDTVNPGAPAPRIAPPGGASTPKPLGTRTTPATGVAPLQSGVPPREVQPGEETPRAESSVGGGTVSAPRRRKTMGKDTGDDDDIDDTEVQRHTVRGVETPGKPAKGGTKASSGGDGTQTEDELYVGRKATDTPLDSPAQTPGAAAPGTKPQLQKPAGNLTARPPAGPAFKGPGAVIIPRENCGTWWSNWGNDPNANPCPANCERGERLDVKQRKDGNKVQYQTNYRCFLPEVVVNQPPAIARQLAAGGVKGKNCGTFWTTRQSDPNADVNPCPANCERGELNWVKRGMSEGKSYYEMNYRCYVAGSMAKAGASGADAANARADLRKSAGADLMTRPATGQPALSAAERPTGGPGGLSTGGASSTDLRGDARKGLATRPTPGQPPTSGQPTLSATERPTGGPGGLTTGGTSGTDVRGRASADLATRPIPAQPTTNQPMLSATERPTGGPGGMTVGGTTGTNEAGPAVAGLAARPTSGQPIGKVAEPAGGKPALLPPAAVTGFTAKSTGPGRIDLAWNPASGVTEYRLARKDLGGNIHRFNVSATTSPRGYTDTGLRPSTYQYTIVPISAAGENAVDPPSASATVTPACNPATVKLRANAGKERCFGAIGMQCAGGRMGTKKENAIAEAAAPPGVINADCTITQDVAVGSIMHDNCCVQNRGNGAYCSGEAPGTDELDQICMREWRKAVWNKIDGRYWKQTFGPYLSDDDGDQLGTMTARPAKTNGVLGFRDNPQPWPGPERFATRQLKAPPGTPLDIDSGAYCASGRFSLTDWKGPALTKGSEYAKWIADKENEIKGRDAWINSKITEKDAAWKRGDLIKVGALEVEINAARAQNTAAHADLAKLRALREAQYVARVTEWGVCQ